MPFAFADAKSIKVRLRDEQQPQDVSIWEEREQKWRDFWKPRGAHVLEAGGNAYAGGLFDQFKGHIKTC